MKMRKLYPTAVLVPAVFVLIALGLSLFSHSAVAAPVRAHHSAHSKLKKPAHQAGKAASHSGRASATRGKAKPAGRSSRQIAHASGSRGRVHPALRAGGHTHRRQKTWPGKLETVHLAMPPPLRGSHESLVHQNEMAEADGLERILDDADLSDRIAHGSLVPVPVSAGLRVNTDLPENRRYCRPWTSKFLSDLAAAHSAHFAGGSLEVTSAVRTVEYQRRLRHINGNAAAADGDIASPHLTGGTVDIAKAGMTAREIGWVRSWLIPLEQQGKIDVEEEFRQSCFHISVYKSYTDPSGPEKSRPLASTSMLATHLR